MAKQLKDVLGDELYNQVSTKIGNKSVLVLDEGEKAFLHKDSDKVAIVNDGSYVPKAKMDELLNEKKDLQTSLDSMKTELDNLKKSTGDVSQLKQQITDLQTKIVEAEKERDRKILEVKKASAIKDLLSSHKVKDGYSDLISKEFDLSKIELDESGKIKGADDLIKPVKEKYKDMFGTTKFKSSETSREINKGVKPDDYISKKDFQAMDEKTRKEKIELINKSSKFWTDEED